LGTACHSRHHNTFPIAFRTQSITLTEDVKAASEAAPSFFCNHKVLALEKAGWIKYDEITVGGTVVHVYKKPKSFQSIAV